MAMTAVIAMLTDRLRHHMRLEAPITRLIRPRRDPGDQPTSILTTVQALPSHTNSSRTYLRTTWATRLRHHPALPLPLFLAR